MSDAITPPAVEEALLVSLASHPALTDALQASMADTGKPAVHMALAQNASLNEQLQKQLCSSSVEVRCQLAQNPSLTQELQMLMASDEDASVKKALACNPKLMAEVQSVLVNCGDREVVMVLASQPALDAQCQTLIFETFANEEGDWTSNPCSALALNPVLIEELMVRFADSNRPEQLASLATNPSVLKGCDIRLRLMANPELETRVRRQIVDSMVLPDYKNASCDVEGARRAHRHLKEIEAALQQKFQNAVQLQKDVSWYMTAEKLHKLEEQASTAKLRTQEAYAEIDKLVLRMNLIEKILYQKMKGPSATDASPPGDWTFVEEKPERQHYKFVRLVKRMETQSVDLRGISSPWSNVLPAIAAGATEALTLTALYKVAKQ